MGKFDKYYNLPEIQNIRDLIYDVYASKIRFIEGSHEYFVDGEQYISVSEITHKYKPITGEQMAENCVIKWHREQDPSYKYYGKTKEEILAEWKVKSDAACTFGTSVHEFGESMFYYMTGQTEKILPSCQSKFKSGKPEPTNSHEMAVVKFWNDLPENYVPVLAETKVFNRNGIKYCGTFDLMLYYVDEKNHSNNGIIVEDYKGLDIETPILTKEGWKTMGNVNVGDIVYDCFGKETKILKVSEIHNKKCYKLYFNNGESVVADFDHRWMITFKKMVRKKDCVLTTEEIYEFMQEHTNRLNTINIPRIKQFGGIDGEDENILIDPYVLGVWLGDGHSSCGAVTNMYDEIFEEINRRGFDIGPDVSKHGAGKAKTRTIYGLVTLLKKYDLVNNKHIPPEYLIASRQVKLSVLKGLMDTDGYYNKRRKRFVFATTKHCQMEFCVELLSSLGIKNSVIECNKYCKGKTIRGYDITFTTKEYPFLVRKINVGHPNKDHTSYVNIMKIEEVETIPTRCIMVDSPTHTYVFGKNMMITHNTNEDLYKNFRNQKLLPPFNDFLDQNHSYYTLQLSAYQIPLENLGLKTVARRLIWLKPDGTYDHIKIKGVTNRLREALQIPSSQEIITKNLI